MCMICEARANGKINITQAEGTAWRGHVPSNDIIVLADSERELAYWDVLRDTSLQVIDYRDEEAIAEAVEEAQDLGIGVEFIAFDADVTAPKHVPCSMTWYNAAPEVRGVLIRAIARTAETEALTYVIFPRLMVVGDA